MGSRWSLPLLVLLHHTVLPAHAQFLWGFNASSSLNINECAQLAVGLDQAATNQPIKAVPPFYMFAYETSGRTTSQPLGSDATKLTWQVAHPPGSTLLLQVADSTGRSGGVAGLYTVQPGTSSDCNEVPTTSSITIKTNVTGGQVDKCAPISFTITGGTGPYNVTIAAENEATVTNISMPAGANVLNYPNQVTPGNAFIVGVADSTGTWAQNTGLLSSTGSNTTCSNTQDTFATATSSSTTTSTSSTSSSTSTSGPSSSSSSDTGAIAGGVVAGILILALAASLTYFCWRRRRRGRGTTALPPILDTWDMKHGRNASNGAGAALTNHAAHPDGYGRITPFTPGPPSHSSSPGPRARESRYDSGASNPFGTASTAPYAGSTVSYDPYGGDGDPYGGIDSPSAYTTTVGGPQSARAHSTYPPSTVGGWADVSNNGGAVPSGSGSGGSMMSGPSTARRSSGPLIAVNGEGEGRGTEGAAMSEKRQLAERHMRADWEAVQRQQGPSSGPVYQHQDADDLVEELPPAYRPHR